jgi:hypothetical protein
VAGTTGAGAAIGERPANDRLRDLAGRVAYPLGVYALSRVVCFFAGVLGTYVRNDVPLSLWFDGWDGAFYASVVHNWYPSTIPYEHGQMVPSNLAFFPGFPLIGRALSWLPFADQTILLWVALTFGALATVLMWIAAERLWDRSVADRAALLFAFSPGAYVMMQAYSESLVIAVSLGCLLALSSRRWLLAGLLAAYGTATRPSGIGLILCCAVAAFEAIRRNRDVKSVLASLLAPVGIVAFFAYLWLRTGVIDAWFEVEHEIWKSKLDFGQNLFDYLDRFVHHPLGNSSDTIVGLTTIAAVAGLVVMLTTRRLPLTYQVFGVWMLVLPVLSAELLMRPRWLFTAFPVVLAVAARTTDRWNGALVAIGAGAMALLVVYYGCFGGTAIVAP